MTTESEAPNPWRETVRDLYDELHFGEDSHSCLAGRLAEFIEARHPEWFCAAEERDSE